MPTIVTYIAVAMRQPFSRETRSSSSSARRAASRSPAVGSASAPHSASPADSSASPSWSSPWPPAPWPCSPGDSAGRRKPPAAAPLRLWPPGYAGAMSGVWNERAAGRELRRN